jgi:hypothetical protein
MSPQLDEYCHLPFQPQTTIQAVPVEGLSKQVYVPGAQGPSWGGSLAREESISDSMTVRAWTSLPDSIWKTYKALLAVYKRQRW